MGEKNWEKQGKPHGGNKIGAWRTDKEGAVKPPRLSGIQELTSFNPAVEPPVILGMVIEAISLRKNDLPQYHQP